MGKTSKPAQGSNAARKSSLRDAVLASEARKKRRAADGSKKRTPHRSRPAGTGKKEKEMERSPIRRRRASAASSGDRKGRERRRSRPASRPTRRSSPLPSPRAPPEPEALRLTSRPVPPRGSVAQVVLRRPAAVPSPGEEVEIGPAGRPGPDGSWYWSNTWPESYEAEGGVWQVLTIRRGGRSVKETWQWSPNPSA